MRGQPRWFAAAGLPLAVGLCWLAAGWAGPWVVAVLATLPGVVLIATGCALLLWPGDRHIVDYMALAGAASLPLALLLAPWLGLIVAALLALGAVAAFLVAGFAALLHTPLPRAVPAPRVSVALARKVATDAALLAGFTGCARIPRGDDVRRDARELAVVAQAAVRGGWAHDPRTLHCTPGAPAECRLQAAKSGRHRFEWLTFDSGFEVDPRLPGGRRWHDYAANRRMAARVFEHPGGDRPWLMCIHGYRMGLNGLDLSLFDVGRLHRRLGYNLIMPILPLHGARRATRVTGGLFLDGTLIELLHAQTQALWDLRRCLAWLRLRRPHAPVGALGYSLGGYNAALLACFEPTLACVIAGIPLVDMPGALWRHMPGLHLSFIETQGVSRARVAELFAPVSPLAMAPRVEPARRFIFAATGDQLVPPEQPLALWRHWEQPAMHWYHGSHLSVRGEPGIDRFIERSLAASGLAAPAASR